METYKISKGGWYCLINKNSLEEAEEYAVALGEGHSVAVSEEKIIELSLEEKIQSRMAFGQYLISTFILDNAQHEIDNETIISTSESADLFLKLQLVLGFAQIGSIKNIKNILPSIEIDDIFTQARKDKYQLLINNYLI